MIIGIIIALALYGLVLCFRISSFSSTARKQGAFYQGLADKCETLSTKVYYQGLANSWKTGQTHYAINGYYAMRVMDNIESSKLRAKLYGSDILWKKP